MPGDGWLFFVVFVGFVGFGAAVVAFDFFAAVFTGSILEGVYLRDLADDLDLAVLVSLDLGVFALTALSLWEHVLGAMFDQSSRL